MIMKKLTKDQLDLIFIIENMVLDLTDENEDVQSYVEWMAYMKVAKMLKSIRDEDRVQSIKEYESKKKSLE